MIFILTTSFFSVFLFFTGLFGLILKTGMLNENKYRNAGKEAGYFYRLQKMLIYKPVILRLAAFNRIFGEDKINHWYKRKLITSGNPWRLIPVEFFAYKELLAVLFGILLSYLYFYSTNEINVIVIIISIVAGFRTPNFLLDYKIKERKKSILIDLPFFIDIIALAAAAGLDFKTAIEKVVKEGRPGYLRSEFDKLLQDLKVSPLLNVALNNMADRIDLYEVRSLVLALIQADKQGTPIKDTLKTQSEIRLEERFLKAEKLAQEAPAKIIFPLVLCIFPPVLMIIGVPFYLKYLESGGF